MRWTKGKMEPGLDGYNICELDAAHAAQVGDVLVPAFVELLPAKDGKIVDAIAKILALAASDSTDFLLHDHEIDHLVTILEGSHSADHCTRMTVYCHPDHVTAPDLWRVLSVGPPIARPQKTATSYQGKPVQPPPNRISADPIVAVIDDGIGFLNARFRKTKGKTRIEAMWIMGPDQGVGLANPVGGNGVISGRVLTADDIDAMLATGTDEDDLYRDLNDALFPIGMHRATNRAFGHGTHVLDLAAGQDIAAGPAKGRILAVQLPPEAIAATSGRRLEHCILQALRWILHRVTILNQSGQAAAPVIVNLSLGALAGPKDGTGFFESWLRHEITTFQTQARSAGIPLRIVAAYGNGRRDRLVGQRNLDAGGTVNAVWNVLPDDHTASYLELRAPVGTGRKLAVTLTPPGHVPRLTLPTFLTGAQMVTCRKGGTMAAGVFAMPEADHDTLLFALAPTVADLGRAVSEPGPWRISITNKGQQTCHLSVRIRRDDTPAGFRLSGRQSWLDDADGWSWDGETQDWSSPNLASAVTRQGSEVNFSSVANPCVYFVAAGEPDPGVSGGLRPSRYSAEGVPGQSTSPTLLAGGDDGRMLAGRLASGIVTGSHARMAGTSAAAPATVAALAAAVRAGLVLNPAPGGTEPPDSELQSILHDPPAAIRDPRRGAGQVP
jgi:hypothetical protein